MTEDVEPDAQTKPNFRVPEQQLATETKPTLAALLSILEFLPFHQWDCIDTMV
jgi:hypothetical protein